MKKSLQKSLKKNLRATFADRWSDFLKETFENPLEVAVAFGVTGQTAENWWSGANAPSGFAVAFAFLTWRKAIERQFGSAA